jgi:uncharacterized membrane protein
MSKQWTGSVWIEAPVEEVYAYLADFTRHPEWDQATIRVEPLAPGDATGAGAEYKAYEALNTVIRFGERESFLKDQAGLAKRTVTAVVPGERIAWRSHPVPRMGTSAECAFAFAPEAGGTRLTQTVEIKTLPGMDAVTGLVFRSLDEKHRAQWDGNLARLKQAVERVPAVAGD